MSHEISGALILCSDFEQDVAQYCLLLGCDPSWSGRGSDGTQRAHFALENIWLEVIDINTCPADWPLADRDRGQTGLFALAFTTTEGGREGDDVTVGAQKFTEYWHDEKSSVPLLIRIPDPQNSDPQSSDPQNSALKPASTAALAVDHIVVQTANADRAHRVYGEILGLRLALRQNVEKWGGEMLFYRSRQMSVEVIANPQHDPQDHLWGLALRCPTINGEIARLQAANVTVSACRDGRKAGTYVATVKSHDLGIPTLLIEHITEA